MAADIIHPAQYLPKPSSPLQQNGKDHSYHIRPTTGEFSPNRFHLSFMLHRDAHCAALSGTSGDS